MTNAAGITTGLKALVAGLGRTLARWAWRISTTLGLAFAFLIILWFGSVIEAFDRSAPAFARFDSLKVVLAPGASVAVGRRELIQPAGHNSAAQDHVMLSADANGEITIRRVNQSRNLYLRFWGNGDKAFSNRIKIADISNAADSGIERTRLILPGQVIDLHMDNQSHLVVSIATNNQMANVKTYMLQDNDHVLGNGHSLPPSCSDPNIEGNTKLFLLWAQRMGHSIPILGPILVDRKQRLWLSGTRDCRLLAGEYVLAIPDAPDGVEIVLEVDRETGFAYAAVSSSPAAMPFSYEQLSAQGVVSSNSGYWGHEWPLLDRTARNPAGQIGRVSEFIVGRTGYAIGVSEHRGDGSVVIEIEAEANRVGQVVHPVKVPMFNVAACAAVEAKNASGSKIEDSELVVTCPPTELAPEFGSGPTIANLGRPIERLYKSLSTVHLDSRERAFWLGLFGMTVLLFLRQWRKPRRGKGRAQVFCRITLEGTALFLAGMPIYAASIATQLEFPQHMLLFVAGLLLLATATILIWWEKDGMGLLKFAWIVQMLLLLLGAFSVFVMSAEGAITTWERFFIKHQLYVLTFLPLYAIYVSRISIPDTKLALGRMLTGHAGLGSMLSWILALTTLSLLMWLFVGDQHGIAGIQPVELGKFIVVVLLAALAAQWLVKDQVLSVQRRVQGLLAVILILLFLAALFLVPYVRSDYSPAIIVFVTVLLVIELMGTLTALRVLVRRAADVRVLQRLPLRFLPTRRDQSNWFLKQLRLRSRRDNSTSAMHPKLLVVLVAFIVVIPAVAFLGRDQPVRYGAGVEGWSWQAPSDEQIEQVRLTLGGSRRLVKERLMGWADLRLNEARPDVQLPAFGYQVVRSRVAIAHAICGIAADLVPHLPQSAAPEPLGRNAYQPPPTPPLQGMLILFGICHPPPPGELPVESTQDCGITDLSVPVIPHCIPVVQSDFAATFLTVRFGTGTALLLVLAQGCWLAAALLATGRLLMRRDQSSLGDAVNQSMGVIVIGSMILLSTQWALAWGNALGLLPVMGQPMTWLSTATSHHVFMAIPASAVTLLAIRIANSRQELIPFRWVPRR